MSDNIDALKFTNWHHERKLDEFGKRGDYYTSFARNCLQTPPELLTQSQPYLSLRHNVGKRKNPQAGPSPASTGHDDIYRLQSAI